MIQYGKRNSLVLTLDIENRPLSYLGQDFTTSEITAIACKWSHMPHYRLWMLGEDDPTAMLIEFWAMYRKADVVTGHYIRNHDLPIINGALAEYALDPLPRKMTIDTKNDLIGFKGISKSQENLAEMFGIEAPKVQMNQIKWRQANRLTPKGLHLTAERVVGDIMQHEKLREELHHRKLLKEPKAWG